jgi:hypothetical protein
MRLFCRDDHDESDICPPHEFEGGWASMEADGSQAGVIFCKWCGDIRLLTPPSIEASTLESEPAREEAQK